MPRLTQDRHAELLQGLATVAATMARVNPDTITPNPDLPGTDAQMLYSVCAWMAPILEEVLHAHVVPIGTETSDAPLWIERWLPTFLGWWRYWTAPARPRRFAMTRKPTRLTKRRHAGILEHLATLRRLASFVSEGVSVPPMSEMGTEAQQLWQAYAWMAPTLEDLLLNHAVIAPTMTPDDEPMPYALRDRFRGMAGGAFGRATAGGAPGEKGV